MAAGNRRAFEQTVLKWVAELDPTGRNVKLYEEMFAKMSDKDIERYVEAIETEEDFISLNYENLDDSKISVDRNLKVGKKLGHNFFQHLWLTDDDTGKVYLTPVKYLVADVPVRRQVQMLYKKMSVPKDNMHVDELTNQPNDASKGSGVSFPEILVLYSQGMHDSILEFIKLRGGDQRAYNAMERTIAEQGAIDADTLINAGTRVKSTETLQQYLKAMHLDNNL